MIRKILDVLDKQTRKTICNLVCKLWSEALWLGTPFEEPLSSRSSYLYVAYTHKIKKEVHAKKIWGGKRGRLSEYQVQKMQQVAKFLYAGRPNCNV